MAVYTGTRSDFDELRSGVDSSGPSAAFRVAAGQLSYGALTAGDSDWYELRLDAPGSYRLVLSNDPDNALPQQTAWDSTTVGLRVRVVGSDGLPAAGWGTATVSDFQDGAIGFVWTGSASSGLYVRIDNPYGTPAHYVLTLESQGAASGGTITGTLGIDELIGGSGTDALRSSDGDDRLDGGTGNDTLVGGFGRDLARYAGASGAVQVDLSAGTATGAAGNDTLTGIEDLIGSAFGDRLVGNDDDNRLDGGAGDDTLSGGAGADRLDGGAGDEVIDGGEGRDTARFLVRRADATIAYDAASGELRVTAPGLGTDRLRNVEVLQFTDADVPTAPYVDRTAPAVAQWDPAAGATTVRTDATLTATFSEPVLRGSGKVRLTTAAGETVAVYDVWTSPELQLGAGALTVDPAVNLRGSTGYRLAIDAGAYVDAAGLPLPATVLSFTTAAALPEISIADARADERDGSLRFVVTLSEPLTTRLIFAASVADARAATVDADYIPVAGGLVFEPGVTRVEFRVPLINDAIWEPTEAVVVQLGPPSQGTLGRATARGEVIDDDGPAAGTDTLLPLQWPIFGGAGADVLPVWADHRGAGVRIGLLDQGIDATSSDLVGAIDLARGRRVADTLLPGGAPPTADDLHGTAAAGVIAARSGNGGLVGVAFDATLVSYASSLDDTLGAAGIAAVYRDAADLDVLLQNWGGGLRAPALRPWAFLDTPRDASWAAALDALATLAATGRHGLGTVVVQPAGNGWGGADDTNLHALQNNRHVITVASTDAAGRPTAIGSGGASILVAAPGGGGTDAASELAVVDRSGDAGYAAGDTALVRGVALGAPVVAGIVAVMVQARPDLGWRDVQQILAMTARRAAEDTLAWNDNGATHWNGGGLHIDAGGSVGFGLVDARAAVRLAESWAATPLTSATLRTVSASMAQVQDIPDGGGRLEQHVTVADDVQVERAEVAVRISHERAADLALVLRSPAGTESTLLARLDANLGSPYSSGQQDIDFTFTTVLPLGERAAGRWTLAISDGPVEATGMLQSWTLTVLGAPVSADDTHVYTDEYAASVARGAARAALADTGGHDTLNAAATSTANRIDLTPGGSTSRLGGQALAVAAGTVIEDAWGGDGDDVMVGNDAANHLHGQRGNDRLTGGAGDDVLDGGAGLDTVAMAGLRGTLVLGRSGSDWTLADRTGSGGSDRLAGVERVQFGDMGVALDVGVDGHAGQVAQIIRALFGAGTLNTRPYVGVGLTLLDGGMSYADLVALAIGTDVFAQLAGSRGNADFVKLVYRNVVGVAPGAADLAYFTGLLDSGAHTQASLGVLAAQVDLNTQSVELLGLASTGIEYTPA